MIIDKRDPRIAAARKSLADSLRQCRAISRLSAAAIWRLDKENRRLIQELFASLRPEPIDVGAIAKLYGLEDAPITASTDAELRAKILERIRP